jgi:hypothetical protein
LQENPVWARIALLLNLAGTILLALSFQATSSDFRLVTASGYDLQGRSALGVKAYALCVNNYTLVMTDSSPKGGVSLGMRGCPSWESSRPAAVVNTEHPNFIFLGLALSSLGFLMQFLTIPRRKTLSEVNEELRILRKQKRQIEISIIGRQD